MSTQYSVTLPVCTTEEQSLTFDSILERCCHINSSSTCDGVAKLGLQADTSILPSEINSKLWKYDWYKEPATYIILVTRLSDGVRHNTDDGEMIIHLGYGDPFVFNM